MSDIDSVCVVTHPLGGAGETATQSLLDILTAITAVSLVAAGISEESELRSRGDLDALVDVSIGGPVDSIPVAAVQFFVHQIRLAVAIARRDEPIVLFYGATSYLLPILTAKILGRTVVLEPRGDVPLTLRLHWEKRIPSPIARLLAGALRSLEWIGYWIADGIITYTPSMAEELGLDRFERKLYSNGARYVDTERFYPRVPFEEREQVIGFVGRLDEEKNVRMLAEAAKQFPDNVTFRFVGDGDLREELERELTKELETGAVEFTGWVEHDEVPHELSELRLLVLPSEPTEGLPTVILEAFACGTPVLATPVSGVPDVVREGETGLLLEEKQSETVVNGVTEYMRSNVGQELSETARKSIDAEFSFDAASRRYRSMLLSLPV